MTVTEEIVVQVLALDKAFEDTEFFHVFLGPSRLRARARRISPEKACAALVRLRDELPSSGLPDTWPDFRQTYARDFITCVLAQADIFVWKRRRPFLQATSELMAMPVPGPFALHEELARMRTRLREAGYTSVAEYNRLKPKLRFSSRRDLVAYVQAILDEMSERIASQCAHLFPFDLRSLLERSRVTVEVPRADDPPCYYRYRGNYAGAVGIAVGHEFSEAWVRGFVLHEVLPGHHFYYLLKQRQFDEEGDLLVGADTFYSPENPVNEGLAVCADRFFGPLLEPMVDLAVQVEKFLHRLYFNAWRQVNVQRRPVGSRLLDILRHDCGYDEGFIAGKIAYHTREARWYTPVYPLGIRLVEEATERLGPDRRALLYRQHSAGTLRRLYGEPASVG